MKAILTDVTKCVGCEECVKGCKQVNSLAADIPFRWRLEDGLNSTRWTSIVRRDGSYVRKQCRHCLEPACVAACPVGALHRLESGPVVYDAARCMGCRYCMMACPFGVPRYEWESAVPYIKKCTMCAERQSKGEQPGCTAACPEKATIFGDRDELLQEAKKRIADNPGRYIGKVWGETEVGGTGVIYVSDVPLGFLELGNGGGDVAMPSRTAPAMNAVPFAFVGMGVLMGSIYWVIERRNKAMGASSPAEDKPAVAEPRQGADEADEEPIENSVGREEP